jgi:hypothetical protein
MYIFFSFNKRTHTHTHTYTKKKKRERERETDIHMNTVRTKGEINSLHVLGYAYNQHICSKNNNNKRLNQ